MTTAVVPPGVFEFLDATHVRIGQHLTVLRQLVDRIATDGLDHASQERAKEVLEYFNTDARQHHLDEEKHVFPALLSSADAAVVHAAKRLTQDHGWLEENWLSIEPSIAAAADGNTWFDVTELNHALDVFEALYQEHIELEETLAYPEARKHLAEVNTDGMGREMAARRAKQKSLAQAG
ncbi:MAG: hemerythrin domain-containing protein [Burkholderiales bacterium]|nr:hemerythrin domain-containing protein [Burkholderiales bacterium]